MRRCGVFLDRDGTVNEEVNYIRTPDQLRLIPGAGSAIRLLNEHGLPVCIISNQAGVARGFLTEQDLLPVHARLSEELGRFGAHLDRIYYCPHHPTEGNPPYTTTCDCRKPAAGMLLRGARELDIELDSSFVVGDRIVDVQVGQAVGATTVLVKTGYGLTAVEECRQANVVPDKIVSSITDAVEFILQKACADHSPQR